MFFYSSSVNDEKFINYLDIKNCSCEKRLIRKLMLEYEDEILNTSETLLNDKNITRKKSNCLIHTILLIIICLVLLVVIYVSCYFYYTKYQSKQKHLSPFQYTNNKSTGNDIKNIISKWVINLKTYIWKSHILLFWWNGQYQKSWSK